MRTRYRGFYRYGVPTGQCRIKRWVFKEQRAGRLFRKLTLTGFQIIWQRETPDEHSTLECGGGR